METKENLLDALEDLQQRLEEEEEDNDYFMELLRKVSYAFDIACDCMSLADNRKHSKEEYRKLFLAEVERMTNMTMSNPS